MSRRPPYLRPFMVSREHDLDWQLPGFESRKEAERRHGLLLAKLRRRGTTDVRFADCYPDDPCNSAACPICMRKFRRWMVACAANALNLRAPLIAASLIDAGDALPLGALGQYRLDKAKRRLSRRIERCGLSDAVVFGGIDFSLNVDAEKRWPQHWQPHFYLIFQAASQLQIKEALQGCFQKAESTPRPIHTDSVKDFHKAASYAVKSQFNTRVSYRSSRDNTRKVPTIPDARLPELLTFLDQWNPVDRLFRRNIDPKRFKPSCHRQRV